jgi:hypothetical protein
MSIEDQAVTNPVETIPAATEEEQLGLDAQEDPPESKNRDRTHPLNNPSQEAVAQFFAAPDCLRDFTSVSALASHLKVSRMTIHRWEKAPHVRRRVEHLSLQNKFVGDLFLRREWKPIVEKAVEKAKGGDVAAMRFCADWAWPKSSIVDTDLSLSEAIRMTENKGNVPSWLLERRAAQENPAQEPDVPSEAKSLPEPAS